ncbi:MAG: hypothetical protein ACFFCV_12650 [Promethearchaeota archaeon]
MVFNEILKIYKIGKELGLSRKEINASMFFRNRYPLILSLMLLIILTIFAILFWNIAIITYAKSMEPVYPRGTLYSSVNLKEFKIKKNKYTDF